MSYKKVGEIEREFVENKNIAQDLVQAVDKENYFSKFTYRQVVEFFEDLKDMFMSSTDKIPIYRELTGRQTSLDYEAIFSCVSALLNWTEGELKKRFDRSMKKEISEFNNKRKIKRVSEIEEAIVNFSDRAYQYSNELRKGRGEGVSELISNKRYWNKVGGYLNSLNDEYVELTGRESHPNYEKFKGFVDNLTSPHNS